MITCDNCKRDDANDCELVINGESQRRDLCKNCQAISYQAFNGKLSKLNFKEELPQR